MKLGYQISTPEVRRSDSVTAFQGELEASFRALKAIGYDGIELMVADPKKIDAETVNNLSSKYSLPVCMVCTGEVFGQEKLFFSDLDPIRRRKAIEAAKDAAKLAKATGANKINIGRLRGGTTIWGDHEKEISLSLTGLKEVAQFSGSIGVQTALEPVNSIACSFINSTQDGIEVINALNEPALKLMLDSNHMYIEDKDPLQSIMQAMPYTIYVHLADSNRLYPGQGKIDFLSFIQRLHDLGYDSWLTIEVFQRPNQVIAAQRSYDNIQPILEKMNLERS